MSLENSFYKKAKYVMIFFKKGRKGLKGWKGWKGLEGKKYSQILDSTPPILHNMNYHS